MMLSERVKTEASEFPRPSDDAYDELGPEIKIHGSWVNSNIVRKPTIGSWEKATWAPGG